LYACDRVSDFFMSTWSLDGRRRTTQYASTRAPFAMSARVGACCGRCVASSLCSCPCWGEKRRRARKDGDEDVERASERGEPMTPRAWRGVYASAFVAAGVATWILRDAGGAREIGKAFDWKCADAGLTRSCAHEAATRTMLGSSLFFALMLVLTLGTREVEIGENGGKSARARWNESYWLVKAVLWVGLTVAALAMPIDDYEGLVNADRFFAAVFLLIQLIVLFGWVYDVNEKLMTGMEEGRSGYLAMLLSSSLALYGAAFTLIGFLYKYWAPSKECSRNIAMITCMLILCVIFSVISLNGKVNGGLFTSGAMTFYCVYILASALASEPANYECAPTTMNDSLSSALSIIGFVIALCALGYTAHNASKTSALAGERSGVDEDDPTSRFNVTYFHAVFFTASSYCAMLFVDWNDGSNVNGAGWESAWAKVACAFVSAALYTWALIAPKVLKNREFR
jgi:serine incorporator 1/3